MQPFDRLANDVGPVLIAQIDETLLGAPCCGDLRQDVALALARSAYIGEDEVELLPIYPFRRDDPQRADPETLLPGIGRACHVAARHGASDIGPMGQAYCESAQLAIDENGPDGLHVGQMIAPDLRQVEQPDITG